MRYRQNTNTEDYFLKTCQSVALNKKNKFLKERFLKQTPLTELEMRE